MPSRFTLSLRPFKPPTRRARFDVALLWRGGQAWPQKVTKREEQGNRVCSAFSGDPTPILIPFLCLFVFFVAILPLYCATSKRTSDGSRYSHLPAFLGCLPFTCCP